jgi:hypothetical protein
MPWENFRHYFGADEVEDGASHHLPAAQAWYDSVYRGVGGGGNCFGMTLRAIRTLFWHPWSVHEAWWNSHRLARAEGGVTPAARLSPPPFAAARHSARCRR